MKTREKYSTYLEFVTNLFYSKRIFKQANIHFLLFVYVLYSCTLLIIFGNNVEKFTFDDPVRVKQAFYSFYIWWQIDVY